MKKNFISFVIALLVSHTLFAQAEKWFAPSAFWQIDSTQNVFHVVASRNTQAWMESSPASQATFKAIITPESRTGKFWSMLGIGVGMDRQNYWHLSLVNAPEKAKSFTACELSSFREGRNQAQLADKVKCLYRRGGGKWEFGKSYTLTLKLSQKGISGDVKDFKTGDVVFETAYEFGDSVAVKSGRPLLNATGGFCGVIRSPEIQVEKYLDATQKQKVFPPYQCESYLSNVKSKATGFFRIVQNAEGRWQVIDPLGRGMVLLGIDHVTYDGHFSHRSQQRLYKDWNDKHYSSRNEWEAETLKRLKSWGFNMLGAGCLASLERKGFAHTRYLMMGDELCFDKNDDTYWISLNEGRPCTAFPNVFHPDFPSICDNIARERCASEKDDPWLFGYFIDNELSWWGRSSRQTGMFDAVMKKRDGHSAKQALLAYVAQELSIRGRSTNEWSNLPKSVQDEIKYGFLRLTAEKYFSITAAAIRRHDPNHLVLGARFAGLNGADPVVWEVAGKYCDAITFNCYPWADLERGEVMTDSSSRAKSIVEAFTERYERAGKPFLITEWSFPATDTSCPCRYGGGQRLRTQSERAKASDLFARTLLSLPFLIGYDYFMWVDEPAAGISDAFPEDSNYGLVNENGKPYGELVDVFTRLHSNLEKAISSSCPKPIPDVLRGGVSLDTYKEKTGYYSSTNILYNVSQTVGNVSNLLGLALNFDIAYKGKGVKFSLNDKPIGDFCIMLNYLRPDGSETWVDAFRTVQATKDGSSLVVVNSGGYMPRTFKLKTRFTFSSEKSSVIAELLSIENTGKDTLVIKDILFRAYPAFKDRETSRRFLPNRWTGRQMSDSWRAVDGRVFTLSSKAPWSQSCQFYIDPKKGTHIPDAVCRPPEPFTLLPGKTYQIPNGSAWFEIKCTMD